MNNLINTLIFLFQVLICYNLFKYINLSEKERKYQNQINILVGQRIDAISQQIDILSEITKLESERLDVYKNDDENDADWWKKEQ